MKNLSRYQTTYEICLMFLVASYAVLVFANPNERPFLTPSFITHIDIALSVGFAIEYIIRLYHADKKLSFIIRNWFDLVAVIPVNPHMVFARFLRLLRLVRILRSSPFVRACFEIKQIQRMFLLLVLVMVWSSGAIYFLEHGINPTIKDYGDALWWSVVTLSTVGYGDVYPVTAAGRIISVVLMISGVGFVGTFATEVATHWKQFTTHPTEDERRREELKSWIDDLSVVNDDVYLEIQRTLSAHVR